MKKNIVRGFSFILVLLFLFAGVLTGCKTNDKSGKLSIVTTIFPEYDWVNQILGEEAENMDVTLLLDNGVNLHSYQPTADDIVTISTCDMFVYVGGHSDEWVDDVLAQAKNDDMVIINLFDILGDAIKEEEIVDGMEHEHEHEHEEEHSETEHDHEHEEDEHVWLSLKNAQTVCKGISEKLSVLDPDNAELYKANVDSYCNKLQALDAEYKSIVDAAPVKTLLFGDRFPFRYLVDDYGIEYYAAFSGCSAESEASFETIAFLAGKVDELGLSSVIILKGSDGSIAKTIVASTVKNAKVLILDSMQTTTAKEAQEGATYLTIMESNLQVLKEALK